MKTKQQINLGLYMRCSTDTQELFIQEEVLDKKAKHLKEDKPEVEFSITKYKDKGLSGKDIERPALQKLLNDIEKKNINCVVITKLDRLSRSLGDMLNTVLMFQNNHCDFIVVEQNIDTSNAQGKLLFHILSSFAEFERSIIRERMEAGREMAKKKGTRSGKPMHRGKLEDGEKRKSGEIIKLDADGVQMKFRNGISMNQIAKLYKVSITPVRRILIEREEWKPTERTGGRLK